MRVVYTVKGHIELLDQEAPTIEDNYVIVETICSAISPGTEIMLKDTTTVPSTLGYSAMGKVVEVGEGVTHVQVGDRVACYGSPFVRHAELLKVPKNLVILLQDQVSDQEAAYVGPGAIAIHALRQADLRFGESVLVVGLGILGQIICQVAESSAYEVFGLDLMKERVEKLIEFGSPNMYNNEDEMTRHMTQLTGGIGVDVVILCVGGGLSGMIDKALGWIRDRGKIIIVGDVAMSFNREQMFQKEAQLLISRAGGPGRYIVDYEQRGIDYPIGYVRWTEGRNMAEYMRLLTQGKINIAPLITHRLPLARIAEAYDLYSHSPREVLGVVVTYIGEMA